MVGFLLKRLSVFMTGLQELIGLNMYSNIDQTPMGLLYINPYNAGGVFGQYKMAQKSWKITETLAYGYSFETTYPAKAVQWIPTWQGWDGLRKSLHPFASDESSRSIRRVKTWIPQESIAQKQLEYAKHCTNW